MMPTYKITPEIISAAITGFESQKTRIDAQIAELRAMLPGGRAEPATAPEAPKGKRRRMSAAARKRIGEAQRKRWSEFKGKAGSSSPKPSKPKRKLSAAGKAAIVAALKKRWEAKRAEAAKAAPKKVARKKAAVRKLLRSVVNSLSATHLCQQKK